MFGNISIINIFHSGRYEAPANFSAVEENHALDVPIYREDIVVPRDQLRRGLLTGALLDIHLPGFPTFKFLKFTVNFILSLE